LPADVAARLAGVRATIAETAARAGRDPAAIRIVAVTKTFGPEAVVAARAAGLEDVGENYVREARVKRDGVAAPVVWHLIGGLQRNKVTAAVATFDWIHTVDSVALAASLARAAAAAGKRMPVLLQVNVAGDPTKRGVAPADVEALARAVGALPALALEGLMTVPPAGDPESSRPFFRQLRSVRDRTKERLGVELPHLSMGMSDDFSVAVEEGATLLRLGRALFGARGAAAGREDS